MAEALEDTVLPQNLAIQAGTKPKRAAGPVA